MGTVNVMRIVTLLVCAALLAPTTAGAFGLGYSYAMHQSKFSYNEAAGGRGLKMEYPAHRLALIDTTGLLATIIASARYDYDVKVTPFAITETQTWSAEYTPISAGVRVVLAWAWYNGEADTQLSGGPVEKRDIEFSEGQLSIGGMVPLHPWYVDFDMVDMRWRDLDGDAGQIDRFLWNFNFETGPMRGPLRVGARIEADLVSVVDAIFDDSATGWSYGLAAHFDLAPIIFSAYWAQYTTDLKGVLGGGGKEEGRSLTFGASIQPF